MALAFGENMVYSSFVRLTNLEIEFVKDLLTEYNANSKLEKSVIDTLNNKLNEAQRSFDDGDY